MMGALPQTSVPTLLAPLAATGLPLPQGAGEAGGFEQLVAVQANAAAPASTGAVAALPAFTLPAGSAPALPDAAAASAPQAAQPALALPPAAAPEPQVEVETGAVAPAPKADVPTADDAVTAANWLVDAIGRFAAPTAAQPAKPAAGAQPGEAVADGEAAGADAEAGAAALPGLPTPPATVTPAAPKPAAESASRPAARRDEAAALPMVTPRPRDAAQPLPAPALAAAEPQAARPAAEPSMAVLFTQPAASAAGIAEAAKPVIVAERTLDLTSDDAWIEQLASDIAATKSATNEVSFRLMPRHLGRLDVAMMAGDEGVTVRMDTQNEAAATIVAAAQPRLVEDLRQQGVRVADAQVNCTPNETGRQSQHGQGRAPAPDAAHLIETADDRADARETEHAAGRRGRFA
ncbi:flagellar hook-length control protein FliK [Sphingopyxis sp. YF1]|uniref:flagellar hook-length control protein FliK n=1 Tax=Sphingopyxis sp. YF1 TaxID=2482763 RepID=UPI001F6209FE|nr:flagellar hook-length control protein FliK [Sphingopyxis sp. YF1]